jgi:putative ABC transport system permease protein
MSIADYLDWRAKNHVFEDPAIFTNGSWRFDLTGMGEPFEVKGCAVTQNFFAVLRSGPLLGHTFDAAASAPNASPAVVLSESLWRTHYAANPAIVGQPITLNGAQALVLGVMPAAFRFPAGAELWTNIRLRPPTRRGPFPFIGIARLRRGVTLSQAQAETNAIGREIERANPGSYHNLSMPVMSLQDAVTGKSRPALLVMFGAVLLLLLIATANVANLMLVRSNTREREMAVRLSLGAKRGRLIRQLLTESLLLASVSGALGLALAEFATGLLRTWNPGDLPRMEDVYLDFHVVVFAATTSLLTAFLFGLAPAWRSTKADLNSVLKQSGRSASTGRGKRRIHGALVTAEVALSFTLLIMGGLLLRSFIQLESENAGFYAAPEQVLAIGIAPDRSSTTTAQTGGAKQTRRYERILDRIRMLPGVEDAALSDSLPPDRRADYDTFQIEGQAWTESRFPAVTEVIASPEYFRTLRIPLLKGRYFNASDAGDGRSAIILSESLARRYFPDSNPIGQRIAPSGPDNHNQWLPIVGVVGDVKYTGLDSSSGSAFYRLYTEFPDRDTMKLNLIVRSSIIPGLEHQIEHEIRAVDPNATLSDVGTLQTVKSVSVAEPRFRSMLIGSFALLALLLSAIGVYGVMSYSVAQRTNEIGIRMALGAPRIMVLKEVISGGAVLALAGVGIGYAGAVVLTRLLSGLLFSTSTTDMTTFVSVTAILIMVAIMASLLPAVRATRIDPVTALRYE